MIWENNEDIILKTCDSSARAVQHVLDECRELRTPYVVITPAMREVTALRRIIVPVSRLEEVRKRSTKQRFAPTWRARPAHILSCCKPTITAAAHESMLVRWLRISRR